MYNPPVTLSTAHPLQTDEEEDNADINEEILQEEETQMHSPNDEDNFLDSPSGSIEPEEKYSLKNHVSICLYAGWPPTLTISRTSRK